MMTLKDLLDALTPTTYVCLTMDNGSHFGYETSARLRELIHLKYVVNMIKVSGAEEITAEISAAY